MFICLYICKFVYVVYVYVVNSHILRILETLLFSSIINIVIENDEAFTFMSEINVRPNNANTLDESFTIVHDDHLLCVAMKCSKCT